MSEYKDQTPRRDADLNDEIDLMEIWRLLVKYKRMIFSAVLGAAIVAAGVSLMMPNIYRAETLLAPVKMDDGKSGVASALGGMGGLASMAGLSLSGGGSNDENIAVLKSREFLWQFVQNNNLMPILFEDEWDAQKKKWESDDPKKQPGQWDVYRLLTGVMSVSSDKKTELVTIAFEAKDARFAAKMSNDLVSQVNQYLAGQAVTRSQLNLKYLNEELARTQVEEMRKILFEMIANEQKKAMMANTQKDYAFKVLDHAAEPDKKVKPKRAIIVVLTAVLAGFAAVLAAFIKEGSLRRRNKVVECKE